MSKIILYQIDSSAKIQVSLDKETIWLTQKQIAELFGTEVPAINMHIKNIYNEGSHSVTRIVEHYNLDVVISIGYWVNSSRAPQFRIWATERLKAYIIKGFTLDDERIKGTGGRNTFDADPRHPQQRKGILPSDAGFVRHQRVTRFRSYF